MRLVIREPCTNNSGQRIHLETAFVLSWSCWQMLFGVPKLTKYNHARVVEGAVSQLKLLARRKKLKKLVDSGDIHLYYSPELLNDSQNHISKKITTTFESGKKTLLKVHELLKLTAYNNNEARIGGDKIEDRFNVSQHMNKLALSVGVVVDPVEVLQTSESIRQLGPGKSFELIMHKLLTRVDDNIKKMLIREAKVYSLENVTKWKAKDSSSEKQLAEIITKAVTNLRLAALSTGTNLSRLDKIDSLFESFTHRDAMQRDYHASLKKLYPKVNVDSLDLKSFLLTAGRAGSELEDIEFALKKRYSWLEWADVPSKRTSVVSASPSTLAGTDQSQIIVSATIHSTPIQSNDSSQNLLPPSVVVSESPSSSADMDKDQNLRISSVTKYSNFPDLQDNIRYLEPTVLKRSKSF